MAKVSFSGFDYWDSQFFACFAQQAQKIADTYDDDLSIRMIFDPQIGSFCCNTRDTRSHVQEVYSDLCTKLMLLAQLAVLPHHPAHYDAYMSARRLYYRRALLFFITTLPRNY